MIASFVFFRRHPVVAFLFSFLLLVHPSVVLAVVSPPSLGKPLIRRDNGIAPYSPKASSSRRMRSSSSRASFSAVGDEDTAGVASWDDATGQEDVGVALLVVGKVTSESANILLELTGSDRLIDELCARKKRKLLWLRAHGLVHHPIQVAANLCEYLARKRPYVFRFETLPHGTRLEIVVTDGLKYNNEAHVFTPQSGKHQKLGVVSCNKLSYRLEEVPASEDLWDGVKEKVTKREIDGILHLGDQVYLDNDRYLAEDIQGGTITKHGRTEEQVMEWCPYCRAEKLLQNLSRDEWMSHAESIRESFRDQYRKTWGHPPMAYVLANTKNYFITDDHELRDDLGHIEEFDKNGMQFFLSSLGFEIAWEYQYALMGPWKEPRTRAYYHANLTSNIGLFMIDPRIARSILQKGNAPEEERMLQQKQWEMLRTTLGPNGAASDWDVLLLGTPLPLALFSTFSNDILKTQADDAEGFWAAYPKEMNNLLQLLEKWQDAKSGRKVQVVSGDVHTGGHTGIYPKWGGKPLFMQLTSSSVSNREPTTQLTQSQLYQVEFLRYIKQQIGDYSYEHKGWTYNRNFGMLDINAPLGNDPVIVQRLYVSDGKHGLKLYSEYSIDTIGWSLPTEFYLIFFVIQCVLPGCLGCCYACTQVGTQKQPEDAKTGQEVPLEGTGDQKGKEEEEEDEEKEEQVAAASAEENGVEGKEGEKEGAAAAAADEGGAAAPPDQPEKGSLGAPAAPPDPAISSPLDPEAAPASVAPGVPAPP